MKKLIIFLVTLMLSISYAQSQQLFALNEPLVLYKNIAISVEGVTVYSWEEGMNFVSTAIQHKQGELADHTLLSKYARKNYVSDQKSVKLLNKGFADNVLTTEECADVKAGFYVFVIADKGRKTPKVLLVELREGNSSSNDKAILLLDKLIVSLKNHDSRLVQHDKRLKSYGVQLNDFISLYKKDRQYQRAFNDKLLEELEKQTKTQLPVVPIPEPPSKSFSPQKFEFPPDEKVQNDVEKEQSSCPITADKEEQKKKTEEQTNERWSTSFVRLGAGIVFEKGEQAENSPVTMTTPIVGLSLGRYLTQHIGVAVNIDYLWYTRQNYITTSSVPGGSVYGLINYKQSGSGPGLSAELLYRPVRFLSFSGIIGMDIFSLRAYVREDIMYKQTGELAVRGVPFQEDGLKRTDMFLGAGIDYYFSRYSLGLRSTLSIPGETSYPESTPQSIRNNPPEVLSPQGRLQIRAIQLFFGWQF